MNYKIILISLILLLFILGTVSAEELNSTDALAEGNVKEIYVNDTGDDSNTGSSDSPYASIGKAISDVNESDDATIYIGKGTFSTENDGDFNIDLNHKVFGGNLKFIGLGTNETILDGQNSFRFARIGQNSNVTFINLTFVNFKADNGATLYSEGILTVDNCIFRDSYASGTCGGAIYSRGDGTSELHVTNSKFVSCSVNGNPNDNQKFNGGGAICTDNIQYIYLENNIFINTRANNNLKGCTINIHAIGENGVNYYTKSYIKGNKFVNITGNEKSSDAGLYVLEILHNDPSFCIKNTFISDNEFINCFNPSNTYSIVFLQTGKALFENNTFINSTNEIGNIFLESESTIDSLNFTVINELNNITNYEIINGLYFLLNTTDDMGNIVKIDSNYFSVNLVSENYTYAFYYNVENKRVSFSNVPNPGNYSLMLNFRGVDYNLTSINVVYDDTPINFWVSPNGFDGNDGTIDSPFQSIGHAIDSGFEKSFNVIVHLLEGTYTGENNVELTIANTGSLQIIGENKNNVIIDGENIHWFVKSDTNVTIKNVKFINGYSNTRDLITTKEYRNGYYYSVAGSSLYLENCIIDKSKVEDNYILNGVSFNKLTYTNNIGIMGASDVVNSYFENNTNPEVPQATTPNPHSIGGIIKGAKNIVNSSFINNSAYNGGVIWAESNVVSSNSYYADNSAVNNGVFYINYKYKFTSYNDTFVNNSAVNNGVIGFRLDYSHYAPNPPTFDIVNGTFVNNHAEKAGVLIMQRGTIINSSFINNSADYGGAIIILPTNAGGVSSNMIRLENLTFEDNSARLNGNDVYLSMDIDSSWYPNQELYFALPLNIIFNDLTTEHISDELIANVYGPCDAVIGGTVVNFNLNGDNIGYSEIINGNAILRYSGFENGEFILNGDVDNIYESTINNGLITVNLANYVSNKEVWVSNAGSDENGDGSKNNPFKTIKYAINESTRNCINVIIHIESGTYIGESNTAIEVSSGLNLTLKGENSTVIDGENTTWFIKVLKGKNKITISDLTIRDMGIDNRESRIIGSVSPMTVNEAATLCLDNVLITNSHGGEAIIKNDGNLEIINSLITKNGFSTKALVSGGYVIINNTSMIDNFGVGGSFDCKYIIINNSLIKNSFNLGRYYSLGSGVYSLIEGDCVLENTFILNDGDKYSLKALGLDEVNDLLLPALSLEGNVFMKNVSMVNNYINPPNIETTNAPYTFLSVMGYNHRGVDGRNFTAMDCSFYNFKYLWVLNEWGDLNFTFERCLFKNITQICRTHAVGANSRWVFNNSVFLDVDLNFQRPSYFITVNPTTIDHSDGGVNNVPYDNNFWASNELPIIRYADERRIIFNYSPHNWIVLNNVNGVLKLQLTDGETTRDYCGGLPLSISYASNGNEVVPVITVDGKSYPISFIGDNIEIGSTPVDNPVLLPIVNNTIFSSDLTVDYGNVRFNATFLCPWGDPLANKDVTFTINNKNYTAHTDANGFATVTLSVNAGVHDIIITNPLSKQINVNTVVVNKINPKLTASNVNTVYNSGKYLVINLNAPGTVTVVLNGKTIKKVSDGKNPVKIPITLTPKTYTATITYEGNANYLKASTKATVKVTKATPKMTAKKATLKNKKYTITLKDNKNKAMKKVKVTLKVKGKTYKATTNKKGKATFKITKLTKRGKYTAKVKFKGNKYFRAVTKSVKLTVK